MEKSLADNETFVTRVVAVGDVAVCAFLTQQAPHPDPEGAAKHEAVTGMTAVAGSSGS